MPYKNKIDKYNWTKQWRNTHRDEFNGWARANKRKHKDKLNVQHRNYMKITKGKASRRKWLAKRRNMLVIQMFPNPFSDNIKIEWHHIIDAYIVAIPKELHRMYMGKFHRENTMQIVKQIYLGDA